MIENGILFAAIYGFGWDSSLQRNVFKVLGIGIATLFRFWSYRSWVFKALPVEDEEEEAEAPVAESFLKPQPQPEPLPRPKQHVS